MKNKISFLLIIFILLSCSKDRDDEIVELTGDYEISDFIWKGLNEFYYWQESITMLADSIDDNKNTYTKLISENSDPKPFFNSLLSPKDRFSIIVDDYVELQNTLQGIVASNGMEFGLSLQCSDCEEVFGFVKYVHPDSDAFNKNIKRGNLFTHINGIKLNKNNYRELLYNDGLVYEISLSVYENGIFNLTGDKIELIKEENFQKNPIHVNKIINYESNSIGYLMYNQFLSDYNEELNEVFSNFKSGNITDLILDLRYNGGGSVSNCVILSSLITGQFTGEVFSKQNWNSKLNDYWNSQNPDQLINKFVSSLSTGESLNSLNLQNIYIITSNQSASASELLINGLDSHIQVIQVGDKTVGKNVASITIHDYIDNDGNKNPNHTYAMQPIVLAIENSAGFSDYQDGLEPDHFIKEVSNNLGVLGSISDPLLLNTINIISGSGRLDINPENPFGEIIYDSEMKNNQRLIIETNILNFQK